MGNPYKVLLGGCGLLGLLLGSVPDATGQYIRQRDRRPDPVPPAEEVAPPAETRPAPVRETPVPVRTRTPVGPQVPSPEESQQLEFEADRLEYQPDQQLMVGIGNVRVRYADAFLSADYVQLNTGTQDALARGNVFFERDGRTWEGEQLTYNFKTRAGDFGEFKIFNDPFYVWAKDGRQTGPDQYELQRVHVSTCDETQRKEFVISARSARIDDNVLRARHVVPRLYGVPLFYSPYWKKDFDSLSYWDFQPGHNSRMGNYLLTAYNFHPTPDVKSTTQIDYRSRRGPGGGQRLRWRLPESGAQGRAQVYYTADDDPIPRESQRPVREGLVDKNRYWLGLNNTQPLGIRNNLMMDVNYLSDPFVLEDFFDRDFRRQVQPENRVTLTHRGDQYTAALLVNARLNDFYENVNRLPEASLDVNRIELGSSGFFYESEHSASRLERVFPEQLGQNDYDAVRADSAHTILYPMRHFGFLSVIPSVGYRGTWYSQTPDAVTVPLLEPLVDEQGEFLRDEEGGVLFEETTQTTVRDGSAVWRNIPQFGLDMSFKAFRVLNEAPNYLGTGLRHVIEPYAQYTLVPEPNVLPGELYQFDGIDRLDKRHDIRIGMRNKLQTRRGGPLDSLDEGDLDEEDTLLRVLESRERSTRIHDFIDLNTFTIYRLDPETEENTFDDLYMDGRLRLTDWMRIDFRGAFDWYETEVRQFNTQVALIAADRSRLSAEHRYDRDRRQTVQAEIDLFPREKWSYNAYWRFDVDDGDLEEQTYLVQRRLDCTRIGVGVRGRMDRDDDTEWRVWAQVSLLAFPDSDFRLGR